MKYEVKSGVLTKDGSFFYLTLSAVKAELPYSDLTHLEVYIIVVTINYNLVLTG